MRQNTELENMLLNKMEEMRKLPHCLWTMGNVPEGYASKLQSRQMMQEWQGRQQEAETKQGDAE